MSNGTFRCVVCGSELQPQFRFCPTCGAPTQPQPSTAPATATGPEPVVNEAQVIETSQPDAVSEQQFSWNVTPADESPQSGQAPTQAETQGDSQGGDGGYVDFASLFGYGNTQGTPVQSVAQVEEPAMPQDMPVAPMEEQQATLEEPAIEEAITTAPNETPEMLVTPVPPVDRQAPITGPLPQMPDLPDQSEETEDAVSSAPDENDTDAQAAEDTSEAPREDLLTQEDAVAVVEDDSEVSDTPIPIIALQGETGVEEQSGSPDDGAGQAMAAMGVDEPYKATGAELEAAEPPSAEAEAVQMRVQPEPSGMQSQPEVISFSELFSWQGTSDGGDNSPSFTPTFESVQEQPASEEGQSDTYTAPTWGQADTAPGSESATTDAQEPDNEEFATTVYTFDNSTSHEDEQHAGEVPSWKPGDDTPAVATQGSSASQGNRLEPPSNPVFQSYTQSSSAGATAPTTQPGPVMPPPGQRPKPGTPEYEEMARRVMEQSMGQAATASQPATSPLSTPSYSNPTPPYGYGAEPVPKPGPPPPVQPAIPPPGQRPQPGTPEYEEMARRAIEQRRGPSSGTAPLDTSPFGTAQTSSGPLYSPETSAQSTPSDQPATPPSGQKPKPGTPEYEEMAKRALEERLKQQGK